MTHGDRACANHAGPVRRLRRQRRANKRSAAPTEISPDDLAALDTVFRSGDFAATAIQCRTLLGIQKDSALVWNVLACAELEQGRLLAAEAAIGSALAADPAYGQAWFNAGNIAHFANRLDEALAAYDQALQLVPEHAGAWQNRGNVLRQMERFADAAASYRQAGALDPSLDNPISLAMLQLAAGDYENGWATYDLRPVRAPTINGRLCPRWSGSDSLLGKTLFVHHEQGLGDTIQFVRYVHILQVLGAQVVLSVQTPLVPLMEMSFPGVAVLGSDVIPQDIDFHSPLLSLPFAFATRETSIPRQVPYLSADPTRVAAWRRRLGEHGFRIGVCWQGSDGPADRGRSFPLALLASLAALPDVRLISLHRGIGEGQLDSLPAGMEVETLGPDFDPPGEAFLDTAAVMKVCDLVITSDTAIAHLAGALAVPTWVILQKMPDWRWQSRRPDSPWYATMRLFRQDEHGDWDGPKHAAEQALRALLLARIAG